MINPPRQRASRCQLTLVGWWGRLFTALLFTFYVCFVPIHLATEGHLDNSSSSFVDAAFHHDGHEDGDHDADTDHHTPHPTSDHTLTLTASAKTPNVSALAVFFPPATDSVLITESEPQLPVPVFERTRPPSESPPGPLQPRAPPLA